MQIITKLEKEAQGWVYEVNYQFIERNANPFGVKGGKKEIKFQMKRRCMK